MRAPCKIEDCGRQSAGRGWCNMHWTRWRKHGDPHFVSVPGVHWQVKATCSVEGCGRPNQARLLCPTHYSRWKKHGDPSFVAPITGRPLKGDVPTYTTAHRRLSRSQGPASSFDCVDCGGRASSWSYDGKCPNELTEKINGRDLAYSLDPAHYFPRCTSCHRKFDGAGERKRNERGQFNGDREQVAA